MNVKELECETVRLSRRVIDWGRRLEVLVLSRYALFYCLHFGCRRRYVIYAAPEVRTPVVCRAVRELTLGGFRSRVSPQIRTPSRRSERSSDITYTLISVALFELA